MNTLTKEQVTEGIVGPVITGLGYGLSHINEQETVVEIVEEIKAALDKLKVGTEAPSLDDTIDAGLKLADILAELTPTETDDKIIDVVEAVNDFRKGKGNVIELIVKAIKAKKQAKKEGQ